MDLDSIHREGQRRAEALDRELVPPASGDLSTDTPYLITHGKVSVLEVVLYRARVSVNVSVMILASSRRVLGSLEEFCFDYEGGEHPRLVKN